jgi:hypothetical protein
MKEKFVVDVDSGTIQFAKNPDNIENDKAIDFYAKIQELTGESAASVWDGKIGAAGTPTGDGRHTVIYEPSEFLDWKKRSKLKTFTLTNRSPRYDEPVDGFTLYVGDVHTVFGSIELEPHHYLGGVWLDEHTLVIWTELVEGD